LLTGETPSYSAPAAFGRFEVLHQVGAGVLGPVFLARDPERVRSVAVKVFRLDITPEQAAELASQLSMLARANLVHPSIVSPVEAGVEGTIAYLAEDYVAADSLDAAIRQFGPPPGSQAIRILQAVASALDFAGAVGIHHGALHPRDLLVTPDDTHVTGFGVGRALETIGLRAPMRRPYVAPERVQREGWDARADIHSVGVLARELLVGRPRSDASREPCLADDQAERLQPVLAKATAARPADRFSSCLEFIAAVQDALASRTQAAPVAALADHRSPRGRAKQPAHGPLLPLEAEGPDPSAETPAAGAARLRLADPDALPDMPPAGAVMPAAAMAPLPDLDLHREARDDGQPAEAFDLSDLDGQLMRERAPFRDDEVRDQDEGGTSAAGTFQLATDTEVAFRTETAEGAPPPTPAQSAATPSVPAALQGPGLVRRDRSPSVAVALVAMLIVGIALGAIGGYIVGASQRGNTAASPSATTVTPSPAAATPPPGSAGAPPAASSSTSSAASGSATQPPSPAVQAQPATVSPAPRPAAAKKVVLIVRSTPAGASVAVNGRKRGVTPLRVRMEPGRYTVRVSRHGYATEEREVVLPADRPSSTVTFSLGRAGPARPASQTDFSGSLSVESLPASARVFLDGHLVGTTPVVDARVAAGSHVVRVDRTGFLPWTSAVQIVTGQRSRLTASLERESR
jgi:serine/threonine-protein kinase